MAPLVGTVRSNGRIQFLATENAWVFKNIRRSDVPIHRIKVVPSQQKIEIKDPEPGSDVDFHWLESLKNTIATADAVFLSHKDGALRFGSSMHMINSVRRYYTIGTVQEAEKFAQDRWTRIRYFYAHRLDDFRFNVNTMLTHKKKTEVTGDDVELNVRSETIPLDPETPLLLFDATGTLATNEIVEWRGKVPVGTTGRFDIDNRCIRLTMNKIVQPFTFLEEYREEFSNYSYQFEPAKINKKFARFISRKLKSL